MCVDAHAFVCVPHARRRCVIRGLLTLRSGSPGETVTAGSATAAATSRVCARGRDGNVAADPVVASPDALQAVPRDAAIQAASSHVGQSCGRQEAQGRPDTLSVHPPRLVHGCETGRPRVSECCPGAPQRPGVIWQALKAAARSRYERWDPRNNESIRDSVTSLDQICQHRFPPPLPSTIRRHDATTTCIT